MVLNERRSASTSMYKLFLWSLARQTNRGACLYKALSWGTQLSAFISADILKIFKFKRMLKHNMFITQQKPVPCLLVSERITVESALLGILRLCDNNPRSEDSTRCHLSKVKIQSRLPLDFYTPSEDLQRYLWSVWKRCWGQWNRFSAGGQEGVCTWLWHMDMRVSSIGIWHSWNFSSVFRKAWRWFQTWMKLWNWICQFCQHNWYRYKWAGPHKLRHLSQTGQKMLNYLRWWAMAWITIYFQYLLRL